MNRTAFLNRLRSPAKLACYTSHINNIRLRVLSTASAKHSSRSLSSAQSNNDTPITFQPASRLSGRTCMITGGTSGIGFAIADRFLQEGASSIILVGRSRERLEAAATNLRSSDKVRLLVGDVAEAGTWMRELEKEMVSIKLKTIRSLPNEAKQYRPMWISLSTPQESLLQISSPVPS